MKSTVTGKKVEPKFDWSTAKYPCMGIDPDDEMLVLFRENEMGTVINIGSNKGHDLGDWESNWDMDYFSPVPKGTKVVLEA
jgi:hypothetical protein